MFVHEFADGLYSWEPQLRHFSRRYRCIAFNARGYPPSDVPKAVSKYSQAIATDDIANVMRHLKLRKSHIIGCSMGGLATLHFGLRYARLAKSLTVIGAGYGSDPDKRAQFLRDTEVMARRFEELGTKEAIKPYQIGPSRVQFQNKDPRGFAHFCAEFSKRSAPVPPYPARVQSEAAPDLHPGTGPAHAHGPTHIISGDEDNNCLEPAYSSARVSRRAVDRGRGHRPRREYRSTGSVQPHDCGISRPGGFRPLARARSAFPQ